eukprot:scpid26742/ scgid20172/ 
MSAETIKSGPSDAILPECEVALCLASSGTAAEGVVVELQSSPSSKCSVESECSLSMERLSSLEEPEEEEDGDELRPGAACTVSLTCNSGGQQPAPGITCEQTSTLLTQQRGTNEPKSAITYRLRLLHQNYKNICCFAIKNKGQKKISQLADSDLGKRE